MSRFVRIDPQAYHFHCPLEGCMPLRPRRETTIERIYREVTGRKMPPSVKRILLGKRKSKAKSR
jgi:hypothetical protein